MPSLLESLTDVTGRWIGQPTNSEFVSEAARRNAEYVAAKNAAKAQYDRSAKTPQDKADAVASIQQGASKARIASLSNPSTPWFGSGTVSNKVLWIAGTVFVLWFSRPIIVTLLRNRD